MQGDAHAVASGCGVRLKPSQIPGFVSEYESPYAPAELTEGVAGGAWLDIADATKDARAWRAASRLSILSVGRVATIHGVLKSQVPSVKKLGDLGQLSLGSDFVELGKAGARLLGDLLDYSEALDAVASRVPVLGAYARLAVNFVNFLRLAIGRGKKEEIPPKTARNALGYNREIDTEVVNYCADRFDHDNWTRIFCPAAKPGDSFTLTRTSFIGDGTPDGYTILPAGGVHQDEGLGFCPGVAGRLVQWQYPLKVFNSNRPAGPWESLISISNLEPSASQLTVLAWQMVLKNSPNMFRVNAFEVARRWRDYFESMEVWAKWLRSKGETQAADMANAIATWYGPEYPGGPLRVREPWTKFKRNKVPADVAAGGKVRRLVDYIVTKQLIGSYLPALSTITCAYVAPKSAAFAEMPWLKDAWRELRKRLLEHPNRFDVELDMIPDHDYRSAMERAQRDRPVRTTPDAGGRVTVGFGGVPGIDVPDEPPPTDDDVEPSVPGGLPDLGRGDDEDSDGGGTLAILAIALGLGYVGARKFRKRR